MNRALSILALVAAASPGCSTSSTPSDAGAMKSEARDSALNEPLYDAGDPPAQEREDGGTTRPASDASPIDAPMNDAGDEGGSSGGSAPDQVWWGIGELDDTGSSPRFRPLTTVPLTRTMIEPHPTLESYGSEVYVVTPQGISLVHDGKLQTLVPLQDEVPSGPFATLKLRVADLDADGDPELILTRARTISVWTQVDDAYEEAWSASIPNRGDSPIAIDDIDQDGSLDLILSPAGTLVWFRGDGELGFTRRLPEHDPADAIAVRCTGLFVTDVDADGDRDIVGVYQVTIHDTALNHDSFIGVFANNGDSKSFALLEQKTLRTTSSPFLADDMIDVDEDGVLEVVGYSETGTSQGYWFSSGKEGGGFKEPTVIQSRIVGDNLRLLAADLNSDEHADLLIAGRDGAVTLLGDGVGGFSAQSLPENLGVPGWVALRHAPSQAERTVVAVLSRDARSDAAECTEQDDCPCLFGYCAECIEDADCSSGSCMSGQCVAGR